MRRAEQVAPFPEETRAAAGLRHVRRGQPWPVGRPQVALVSPHAVRNPRHCRAGDHHRFGRGFLRAAGRQAGTAKRDGRGRKRDLLGDRYIQRRGFGAINGSPEYH